MRRTAALLLSLLLAGCLSADRPDGAPEGDAPERTGRAGEGADRRDGPSGGPPTETTRRYGGTIVLRPGADDGNPAYIYTGDDPTFCFGLPTNVTALRGVFSYSPRQQAGLEFQGPGTYATSWQGTPPDLVPESPVTLEVEQPPSGTWFSYGGPGGVGGAMDWTLDLTMVTDGVPSAAAVEWFETPDTSC
jgi:hypothetical protein